MTVLLIGCGDKANLRHELSFFHVYLTPETAAVVFPCNFFWGFIFVVLFATKRPKFLIPVTSLMSHIIILKIFFLCFLSSHIHHQFKHIIHALS